jgi:hypothetical protein
MPLISPAKTVTYILILAGITLSASCSAQTTKSKEPKMPIIECKSSAMEKSYALIRFVLDDLKANYPHVGGGGISEIKQTQTNLFVVSIAQEERIDQLSYQLAVDDNCKVSLESKEESTISFSR